MKDESKLLTCLGTATALFVSPWALICAVSGYATWKFLDHEKEAKKKRIDPDTGDNVEKEVEEEPIIEEDPITHEKYPEEDLFTPKDRGDIPDDIAAGFLNKT